MNTLTIAVLVIFAVLVIAGYVRGLLRSLVKTILTVISILAAYVLAPLASTFVCENTNIDNYFDELIYKTVEEAVGDELDSQINGGIIDIPDSGIDAITDITMEIEPTNKQQEEFIDGLDIPEFAKKMLKADNNSKTRESLGVKNFYHFISAYIAKMIVNAMTFLCVFILIYVISQILIVALGILSRLPIINGANRMGGAALGAVEALLIVWALFLIVAVAINTDIGKNIYAQIEESSFLQELYDANIFLPLVTKM